MGFSVAGVLAFTSYLVGILYKNVHLVVFKMLLREVNVVTIFLTTIVLLFVDFAKPNTSVSAVFSVLYVGCTWIFVSFDLLVKKIESLFYLLGYCTYCRPFTNLSTSPFLTQAKVLF